MIRSEADEFPDPVDSNHRFDETMEGCVDYMLTTKDPGSGRLEVCLGHRRRPCSRHWRLEH